MTRKSVKKQRKPVNNRQHRGASPSRRPTKAAAPRACNDRELVFIDEFLKDFNGTQAVIRAGFAGKLRSAAAIASRMLNAPHVLLELARRRDQLMEKHGISLDLILEELRRIAFARMSDVADWDRGRIDVKGSAVLPESAIAAISELSSTEDGPRLKLHPKLPALLALMERLDPSEAEKRRGVGATGSGVTLIIDGGPTGLEVPTGPSVTVHVGAKQAAPRS